MRSTTASLVLLLGLAAAGLIAISYAFQLQLTEQARNDVDDVLQTVRDTTYQALLSWRSGHESEAGILANSKSIKASAQALRSMPKEHEALLASPQQTLLRELLVPVVASRGYDGFSLIDRDLTVLASSQEEDVGAKSALAAHPALVARVLAGQTATSRPLRSSTPSREQEGRVVSGLPAMFVIAPVLGEQRRVIALLSIRVNPRLGFSQILLRGRSGSSGESYAFDEHGVMLSPTRFSRQLGRIGILDYSHPDSAFNVMVRDPGVDVSQGIAPQTSREKWPLTFMAESAIQGKSSSNLVGYNDYRGVPVVGAWLWDSDWDIGVTTEMDVAEAYANLDSSRHFISMLTSLAVALLAAGGLVSYFGQRRVRDSERKLKAVLDTLIDGVVTINEKGVITGFKGGAESIFGYSEADVVGRNVKLLMPDNVAVEHDDFIQHYLDTGEAKIINIGREVVGRRKDGGSVQLDLGISEANVGGHRIFTGLVRDATERKAMEAELMRHQEYLEQMVDKRTELLDKAQSIAHIGHWEWQGAEARLEWSKEVYRIFGLNPDEDITLKRFLALVHPDDRDTVETMFRRDTDRHAAPNLLDHRIVLKSGEERYVQQRCEIIRDQYFVAERVIGTAQDITDLRLAQVHLAVSEERFKLAMRASNDGLWDWDLRTNEVFFSSGWQRMLGYKDGELRGTLETFEGLLSPHDGPRVMTELRAHIEGRRSEYKTEFNMHHRDGHWVPILSRCMVQYDERTEEPLRMVGTHMDLTERKEIEAELKRSNDRLDARIKERTAELDKSKRVAISLMHDAEREQQRAEDSLARVQESTAELRKLKLAVEQSPVSVIITDIDGRIEYVNPFASQLTQYTVDEMLGQTPRLFKSEVQTPSAYDDLWQTILSGQPWRGEMCNRKKDGSFYWERMVIAPMRDPEGEITNFVAVKEDISAQRAMREAIIMAKEQAESATRAKSAFLAMMSHEIRTPMNGVVGMIDLLAQTRLDGEQQNLARLARESSLSLLEIINDILDFSKIEAGHLKLELLPVSWAELVEGVAELLAVEVCDKRLDLYCLVDRRVPDQVFGDPVRIRQILINLVSNAIKFTSSSDESRGHIQVRVSLEGGESDGSEMISLEVEDNGVGIDPGSQEQLFHPFTQADSSTQRRFGGTGLGLAICAQIVDLMDGTIGCESEVGQGSTFWARLPLNPATARAPALDLDFSGIKMQLLSNDAIVSDFLRDELSARGMEVFVTDSLDGALDHAADNACELVLFDGDWSKRRLKETHRAYRGGGQFRFVVLDKDCEQATEVDYPDSVLVGGNPFRPGEVLRAIAIALGRASPDMRELEGDIFGFPEIPSVDEAEALGRLVLVVEDNLVNQEVIRKQLQLFGFACEIASNGVEALEMLGGRNYGLLLSDCHMPEMDGFELARAIRRRESENTDDYAPKMPIVAITANALFGEAERCLAAGMDDYLSKPVDLRLLKRALRHWFPDSDTEYVNQVASAAQGGDAMDSAHDGPINLVTLANHLGDSPDVQRTFVDKFLSQAKPLPDVLESAAEREDWKEITAIGHKFKSSAATIGAASAAQICASLEQAGKECDTASVERLAGELRESLAAIARFFAEWK